MNQMNDGGQVAGLIIVRFHCDCGKPVMMDYSFDRLLPCPIVQCSGCDRNYYLIVSLGLDISRKFIGGHDIVPLNVSPPRTPKDGDA